MKGSQATQPKGSQRKKSLKESRNQQKKELEKELLTHWKQEKYQRMKTEQKGGKYGIRDAKLLKNLNERDLLQAIVDFDFIMEKIKDMANEKAKKIILELIKKKVLF